MGARRTGRERALQALYQLDQDPAVGAGPALDAAWAAHDEEGARDPAAVTFARELVEGVLAHRQAIDGLVEKHSHHWKLERMQRIDRNVLRLGVFELVHRPEIPRKVTINEGVELAKAFGNEGSGAFVNGLLDRIAEAVKKP